MTSDGKSFLKNAQTVCEFAATLIRERRRMLAVRKLLFIRFTWLGRDVPEAKWGGWEGA